MKTWTFLSSWASILSLPHKWAFNHDWGRGDNRWSCQVCITSGSRLVLCLLLVHYLWLIQRRHIKRRIVMRWLDEGNISTAIYGYRLFPALILVAKQCWVLWESQLLHFFAKERLSGFDHFGFRQMLEIFSLFFIFLIIKRWLIIGVTSVFRL